jgi:ATP-dependent RNA helicase DHX29
LFKCVDAALTIAASLSASKSPFAKTLNEGSEAKAAQASFSHQASDFITFVNVWDGFQRALAAGNARAFCRDKFLNFSALIEIRDARLHYLDLLCDLGFVDRNDLDVGAGSFDNDRIAKSSYSRNSKLDAIVDFVVFAGLYPNAAKLSKEKAGSDSIAFYKNNEQLVIQSSVNSRLPTQLPSDWITFFEKFGTERRVSVSRTAFISPISLILLGSEINIAHMERKVRIDKWMEISVAARTAVILRGVRNRLDELLTTLIEQSHSANEKAALCSRADFVVDRVVRILSHR